MLGIYSRCIHVCYKASTQVSAHCIPYVQVCSMPHDTIVVFPSLYAVINGALLTLPLCTCWHSCQDIVWLCISYGSVHPHSLHISLPHPLPLPLPLPLPMATHHMSQVWVVEVVMVMSPVQVGRAQRMSYPPLSQPLPPSRPLTTTTEPATATLQTTDYLPESD